VYLTVKRAIDSLSWRSTDYLPTKEPLASPAATIGKGKIL